MTKSKKRKTKSKGLKHKRQGLRSIKRCKRCKTTQGGTQKVLISVQPSALGLREDREWLVNNVEHADKHNVSTFLYTNPYWHFLQLQVYYWTHHLYLPQWNRHCYHHLYLPHYI